MCVVCMGVGVWDVCIYLHKYLRIHTHAHAYICIYKYYVYVYMCIFTCIRTYIHTHTHTHAHTQASKFTNICNTHANGLQNSAYLNRCSDQQDISSKREASYQNAMK